MSGKTSLNVPGYTALRDALLTHPTLLERLIPLFPSAPSIPQIEPELFAIDARLVGS
jgi:hypothetical protein